MIPRMSWQVVVVCAVLLLGGRLLRAYHAPVPSQIAYVFVCFFSGFLAGRRWP